LRIFIRKPSRFPQQRSYKMRCHVLTYNIHGLPWCKSYTTEIMEWISSHPMPILCFQELFTASGRSIYTAELTKQGYQVFVPHDTEVSLFPSGLLIAIHPAHYKVHRTLFRPYLDFNYSDSFANKGFFGLLLEDKATGGCFYLFNTHMQSDWEGSIITGRTKTLQIRRKQAEQILDTCEKLDHPVLLIGDLNQEENIHPHLRFLQPMSSMPIRKATFINTGEDLDHIAWLPIQYAAQGCGFCDIRTRGPQLHKIQIHALPFSDHAAVEAEILIPKLPLQNSQKDP
jgi:endonuclease/exonuclease/phosphatase family metal-dependent hydrolase